MKLFINIFLIIVGLACILLSYIIGCRHCVSQYLIRETKVKVPKGTIQRIIKVDKNFTEYYYDTMYEDSVVLILHTKPTK